MGSSDGARSRVRARGREPDFTAVEAAWTVLRETHDRYARLLEERGWTDASVRVSRQTYMAALIELGRVLERLTGSLPKS